MNREILADIFYKSFDPDIVIRRAINIIELYEYKNHLERKLEKRTAQLKQIINASALHDIGKIAISDEILLKPEKLTEDEFETMKTHTTKGCEILENFKQEENEFYQYCYDICRYHHERYDGKGYPEHLKGEEIPISAQIVAVADVYDALIHERVYKSAYSKEQAFQMIMTGECGLFSPKILDCFWKSRKAFEEILTE